MADTTDIKKRKKRIKNSQAEILLRRKEVMDATKYKNC